MGRVSVVLLGLAFVAVASGHWLADLRDEHWYLQKRADGKLIITGYSYIHPTIL